MEVELRLFAVLRERAGRDRLTVELPEGATVAEALAAAGREPGLGEILAALPVRVAVNREYATPEAIVAAGDELALIPPVSGGATAAESVRVTSEPLSIVGLADSVGRPGAGAVVVFCGVTREVERLEYEAYGEMAGERIARILAECTDEARARGRGRRAPGRLGAARRAERRGRRLGRAPRRGFRRRPRGDRPDQGRGADLEARGRGRRRRRRVGGRRPSRRRGAREPDPPRPWRQRPDGRRRREGADAAARPCRGAPADVAGDSGRAGARRRAQGRRARDRTDRRDRGGEAHRRADPARPSRWRWTSSTSRAPSTPRRASYGSPPRRASRRGPGSRWRR